MSQRGSQDGPKAQTAVRRSGKREEAPAASATRLAGLPVKLHSGGTRLVLKIPTATVFRTISSSGAPG